jgi:hypothetical protein
LETNHRDEIHVQFMLDPSWLDGDHPAPSGLRFIGEAMFLPTGYLAGVAANAII